MINATVSHVKLYAVAWLNMNKVLIALNKYLGKFNLNINGSKKMRSRESSNQFSAAKKCATRVHFVCFKCKNAKMHRAMTAAKIARDSALKFDPGH